jgi:hypothetical protein
VRNRINKSIVLFVTADLTNQEGRVEHQTKDDDQEKDNSKDKKCNFPPVEEDPADIERNGQSHKAGAKSDKESYRFAASASNTHGGILKERGV